MLNDKLKQFTGSEVLYKHWAGMIYYTEGVKYVAETYSAYWLIDDISSYQTDHEIREMDFQLWILEVKNNSAVLILKTDTGGRILSTQKIEYTDFPESIKLYVEFGTLLLPGEH